MCIHFRTSAYLWSVDICELKDNNVNINHFEDYVDKDQAVQKVYPDLHLKCLML